MIIVILRVFVRGNPFITSQKADVCVYAMEPSKYTHEKVKASYDHQSKRLKSQKQSNQEDVLDSNVWNKLPYNIHAFIFARLPINEIPRLQSMNKTWKLNISTTTSFFSKTCDKAHPIMLSFITQTPDQYIWVRTLDIGCSKWYMYKLPCTGVLAQTTGGVELFVLQQKCSSCGKQKLQLVNPLTRDCQALPPSPDKWYIKEVEKHGNCVVVDVEEIKYTPTYSKKN